jgi:hypothetical protein
MECPDRLYRKFLWRLFDQMAERRKNGHHIYQRIAVGHRTVVRPDLRAGKRQNKSRHNKLKIIINTLNNTIMSTINIAQLIQTLESGVVSLAETTLHDYLNEAKTDGEAALSTLKSNLQNWTIELESGDLTTQDVAFLIKEQSALDEMTALKQAGLGEVRIDQFKADLTTLVTNTIFAFIKL